MNSDTIVFLGYYSPDQYQLLLKYAVDRKKLDDKWQDWLVNFIKAKTTLEKECIVEEFHIDVQKMNDYFKSNNLKNNGENRSKYINTEGIKNYNKRLNN